MSIFPSFYFYIFKTASVFHTFISVSEIISLMEVISTRQGYAKQMRSL